MKISAALLLLPFIPTVLSDGHANINDIFEDMQVTDHNVVEEVTAEIIAEVEAANNSSTVSVDVVYDIASEVVMMYDNEDENTKSILGHITNAVSDLEEIHTDESGSVSDIITDIMNTAYRTPAPTPVPTVKVTEETSIDSIKSKITGSTDIEVDSASSIISSIFNPPPTPGP